MTDRTQTPPAGTSLVASDHLRAICHPELESDIHRPPTIGDLQMQLTTALQTVDELTAEVQRTANVKGTLHRLLAEREATIKELREALRRSEAELTTSNAARIDAETAMACALKARKTAEENEAAAEAENKQLSEDLARANSAMCQAKAALNY